MIIIQWIVGIYLLSAFIVWLALKYLDIYQERVEGYVEEFNNIYTDEFLISLPIWFPILNTYEVFTIIFRVIPISIYRWYIIRQGFKLLNRIKQKYGIDVEENDIGEIEREVSGEDRNKDELGEETDKGSVS